MIDERSEIDTNSQKNPGTNILPNDGLVDIEKEIAVLQT